MRLLFSFLLFAALSPAQVVISQIYGGGGNSGATLKNDFIELFNRGTAPASVEGWSVQYASATGETWQVTPLTGSIAPGGYYLVQESAGAGGTTALPAADASGGIAMSATAGKVALTNSPAALAGATPTGAVELVSYTLSNTTAYLRQAGGCKDGFSTGAPSPRNSASPANDCSAVPPTAIPVAIHDIQGPGDKSPLDGKNVVTSGVVTGRRSNAFWIQAPESEYDDDPNTSEGLYIYTQNAPPAEAMIGNLVRVTGLISEYAPSADPTSPTLTEMTGPVVELLSAGQPLPPPIRLTRNGPREALEGMRVSVPSLIAISPTGGSFNDTNGTSTSNGVFFGVLPGTPRPVREAGLSIADPSVPDAPVFDGNPERLRVDSRGQVGTQALEVTSGATIANISGPLDYAFRTYTIVPDANTKPEVAGLVSAQPAPKAAANEFSVASFNMQRMVGSGVTQPRLDKAALAIKTILNTPDILAVQEVGDLKILEALASRLGYTAYLEEGNDVGGIDVGFLVNEARVKVLNVVQQAKDTTYTDPNTGRPATLFDRPPLFLEASVGGYPVTVVANHLLSLLDQADLRVRAKKQAQAQWLANQFLLKKAWNLILAGDFNSYPYSDGYVDALGIIKGVGGVPLAWSLDDALPREQGYTYVFDGNAQALDHIIVNASARNRWTRTLTAHMNADFPESYRGDANRPERTSDHDVPVAYFSSVPLDLTPASVVNAATQLTGPVAPGEIVTITGTGFTEAAKVLFDGKAAEVFGISTSQVSATVPYGIGAAGTAELQVQFDAARSAKTTLSLAPYAPGIFTLNRTGGGPGAILNQDYSINSAQKPAAKGSVVMIYATGDGILPMLLSPLQQVYVTIGGYEAEVKFYGPAPGFVSGAVQVNAKIPEEAPSGTALPVQLTFGRSSSNLGVTMAVR